MIFQVPAPADPGLSNIGRLGPPCHRVSRMAVRSVLSHVLMTCRSRRSACPPAKSGDRTSPLGPPQAGQRLVNDQHSDDIVALVTEDTVQVRTGNPDIDKFVADARALRAEANALAAHATRRTGDGLSARDVAVVLSISPGTVSRLADDAALRRLANVAPDKRPTPSLTA